MKDTLRFILENIIEPEDFEIEETEEGDRTTLKIKAQKDKIGIIIGKEGKTIKAIQDLLRAKSKLEKKFVFLSVEEA